MATSDFWTGPAGRWLGSTKNIAGGALAILALVVHLLAGLGPLWPLVVAAAYAAGALLAPPEKVTLRLGLGAGASAEELTRQLAVLRRGTRRLDADAQAPLRRVLAALDDIVARWDELAGAPDQAHTVEQIIGDYLPTSIQRYLDLPRQLRAGAAHDELQDQLGILERESERIRAAVHSRAVQALGNQGRFLREKFGRSELDL